MITSHPPLNAADVAADLRAELVSLEQEGVALAEEQTTLCAELLQIAQDARSGALTADVAKVAIAGLNAALRSMECRAKLNAASARDLRAKLRRHEAKANRALVGGARLTTATLDAVLRGEGPANIGERLAAARITSLTPEVKTDDDTSTVFIEWTGTVWGGE